MQSNVNLKREWNSFLSDYKKSPLDYYNPVINKSINEALEFDLSKVDSAKDWMRDSNLAMVYYPCGNDELENLYSNFLNQNRQHKKMADLACIRIYGIDNETLYAKVKANDNLNVSFDSSSFTDTLNKVLSVDSITLNTYTESVEAKEVMGKLLDRINDLVSQDNDIDYDLMYSPMLSPNEIESLMGVYHTEYGDISDECKNMYNEYRNYFYGFENNFNCVEWDKLMRKLLLSITNADIVEMEVIKQEMVLIGWHPDIPYIPENIKKAYDRIRDLCNAECSDVSIYTVPTAAINEEEPITEAKDYSDKNPVSIVLVKGTTAFSDLTTKITKSGYSHAAICIDGNFEKMYSFNRNDESNINGGLSIESVNRYPKDNNLAVFTIYLSKDNLDKLTTSVQNMIGNIKNTSYSYANLPALFIPLIDLDRNTKLICSQFVDKMLKLADIDITNKKSSKVVPGDFYKVSLNNAKIYKTYEGKVKDFNPKETNGKINYMRKKAMIITESINMLKESTYKISSAIYESLIAPCYQVSVCEARKFVIDVKDNGDVLLNKPDVLMDFSDEYYNSHKLLMQYDSAKNIDGLKYELARLYFMNYILEKRIYNKLYAKYKDSNIKTRARVLNDFNKYMKVVLKAEPSFNFSEYYEGTQFYHNSLSISGGTIKSAISIIKSVL